MNYRGSLDIGGGCRLNFSKDGVGFTQQTKRYRITRTAKGKTKLTIRDPDAGTRLTVDCA